MAKSMTGFGAGTARFDGGTMTVEVHSVNHRHVDLRLDLPDALTTVSHEIDHWVRARLDRGRYDLRAQVSTAAPPIQLDRPRAIATFRELESLRDELSPNAELSVAILANFQDLFVRRTSFERETLLDAFRSAAADAFEALVAMRRTEGTALTADILKNTASARHWCETIKGQVPASVTHAKRRLEDRIGHLLESRPQLDAGRLEFEVAVFADKVDVSEELARLESHLLQLECIVHSVEPVGRKLEFLTQEMMREANTTGSKSQSAAIALAVVELKAAIERIREQVQNLE